MSGGFFDYKQHGLEDVATAIDNLVSSNHDHSIDEYGDTVGRLYARETIERLKEASATIRKAAVMMQRVDWLVCCDDCEASFHSRWEDEVEK